MRFYFAIPLGPFLIWARPVETDKHGIELGLEIRWGKAPGKPPKHCREFTLGLHYNRYDE